VGRGTGFRNGLTREDRLDLKGTFQGLCLPQCLPARTPGDENKEPAKPVDAFRHAAADAGSIPAVSINPPTGPVSPRCGQRPGLRRRGRVSSACGSGAEGDREATVPPGAAGFVPTGPPQDSCHAVSVTAIATVMLSGRPART